MKQDKVIIFKASEDFVKNLEIAVKTKKTTKSALIRACVVKVLNFQSELV